MTKEILTGLIFITVLIVATVVYRKWQRHVLEEEYERFAEPEASAKKSQDSDSSEADGSDSLETSS